MKRTLFFSDLDNIIIPDNVEYIEFGAFGQTQNMEYIEFTPDSKLKCLSNYIFNESSLESISLPSSVSKFDESWCLGIKNLTEIYVIPSSSNIHNIIYYDDNFIIGKSDVQSENYDLLIFARRDIVTAKIQPYCFQYCTELLKVEFENNSQLQVIGRYAFSEASISEINIPSNVIEIGTCSFYNYILYFILIKRFSREIY